MCDICKNNKGRFKTFLGFICKPCYKRKKKDSIINNTKPLCSV